MGWLAAGLAVPVLLVLVLLALPVRLAVEAQAGPAWRLRLRLQPLGGLGPWLALADSDRPPHRPRRAPRARAARRRRLRPRPGWAGRLARALPGFVTAELGRVRIERLAVEGTVGLDDPADTGALFGWLMPLGQVLRGPGLNLDVRPDFAAARIEGRAEAVLRLVPLAALGPVLRLGWRVLAGRR
jgi:hypothetical protein